MHGCTQVLHIISCIFEKLGLLFKVTVSLKPEFLSNVLQAKRFKIDILIYLKTLPKCQKIKEQKKIGFQAQNGEPIEAPVNQLNWLGYRSTSSLCLIEVQSRSAKNTLFLLVAFLSRSMYPPSLSTSSRDPIQVQLKQR